MSCKTLMISIEVCLFVGLLSNLSAPSFEQQKIDDFHWRLFVCLFVYCQIYPHLPLSSKPLMISTDGTIWPPVHLPHHRHRSIWKEFNVCEKGGKYLFVLLHLFVCFCPWWRIEGGVQNWLGICLFVCCVLLLFCFCICFVFCLLVVLFAFGWLFFSLVDVGGECKIDWGNGRDWSKQQQHIPSVRATSGEEKNLQGKEWSESIYY